MARLVPDEGDSAVLITEARELGALRVHTAPEVVDIEPMNAEASRELLTRIAGADLVAAEPEAVGELVEVCGRPALGDRWTTPATVCA
ncbi:hypothetical protein [Amycolatopsis methanolica]|uniref:hypothetical protein n=1 Tax=Amycolatopsis methanolica TaxID=1814 RepID=UPI00343462A6